MQTPSKNDNIESSQRSNKIPHGVAHWGEKELLGIDRPDQAAVLVPLVAPLIPVECVDLQFKARTKKSAIRELVNLADRSDRLWDMDAIRESVERREECAPTTWPGGFAMPHPHVRLPNVQGESVIAFARSPGGIAFGGDRGGMADLFFLICCTTSREHLQVLSRLSRLMRRPGFADELRTTDASSDAVRLIEMVEHDLLLAS